MSISTDFPEFTPFRITGMGAVTPFGDTVEHFRQSIMEGKSAFRPIRLFPVDTHRTGFGAEIDGAPVFDALRADKTILSRSDNMALIAVAEALRQAGLMDPATNMVFLPDRTAVIVGTAAGGILGMEMFFRKRHMNLPVMSPASLLTSFPLSAIATHIAREFGITGPRLTTATVCSSSGLALAAAMELLESGEADYAVAAGCETLSEVTHAGFNILRSVAPDCCRPFDKNRQGLVLGEGAGAMVLERSGLPNRKDVPTLAYLSGYGLTTDLHHFTAPQPGGEAISETIEAALKDAGIEPDQIKYVNAHGTGTVLNDIAETRGLKHAFGGHARKLSVSSTKSMIGHTLGAASIMEAIATVCSLKNSLIPPTANLTTPDPECDLDYTPLVSKKRNLRYAISNSFAFGGSNIVIAFQKESEQGMGSFQKRIPCREPVITGIGAVTPLGVGQEAFLRGIANGTNTLVPLAEPGDEWADVSGGRVDMNQVRDKIPIKIRRRLNTQGAFLYVSMNEAIQDAALHGHMADSTAYVYGSAFGCSGNVHRFYTKLLEEGPQFTSPQEFNFSVTNAPPSLVSQIMALKGPIWVVVADEASFDACLHWGAMLIRKGRANRVMISAAEEISGSVLAIHDALGMLRRGSSNGLVLGEGAVTMVLEAEETAVQRGAKIYGSVSAWKTVNDTTCGPQHFSENDAYLFNAASAVCENITEGNESGIWCLSPENGMPAVQAAWAGVYSALTSSMRAAVKKIAFKERIGESGASSGIGLAAALLNQSRPADWDILLLTSARGGMNSATLVRSK